MNNQVILRHPNNGDDVRFEKSHAERVLNFQRHSSPSSQWKLNDPAWVLDKDSEGRIILSPQDAENVKIGSVQKEEILREPEPINEQKISDVPESEERKSTKKSKKKVEKDGDSDQ